MFIPSHPSTLLPFQFHSSLPPSSIRPFLLFIRPFLLLPFQFHSSFLPSWLVELQVPFQDIMGENLLESYNPLYDVHLRQYFALPHMQKHLRNLGLLDGSPVQQQNELHAGHLAMMDLLLRNRERVLQQLMDLQRKLDAVEKVELYRRIRSGITNADESADRHQHMSRSLSRPARSAAARLGERRGRRQSLSPEAGELIKRVESDYRSDSAPFKNPKSIYNRLAASVYKYQYLHKLDDRTLRKYMLSLRKQLAKLERFREVSFGPHTMAKHPPLQLQQSWFFRRRSLPSLNSANANQSRTHTQQTNAGGQRSLKSGLAPKARSGKSQSPLKFASAIDEPPPKMQRRTSISRTRQQRLPPLPKKRSFAASRTNTLPTSKTLERLPPTATTKPIRNTPSDTRRALPPSSAQKKTPTGSRPGSKGSTTPVFVQKRSSASSGILPAIGGAAVAAAAVGLVLENGGKRAEEGQGRESVVSDSRIGRPSPPNSKAPSPSISLAASQTTTTDGGQPGGDSESEEQLKDSAKTAPEGMNGGTETRPTPEPFLEQEIGQGNLVYEPEVRIESEERIEEQQTPAPTNDGAGMEEYQTEPFQKESSSSLEGQTPQEYSKGVAEVEASFPEESREEGIKELETRSNHRQERIGAVEEASPEERVEEVETRSLEHPEERVEEVETRSLEHPEEFVEEVETRSLEHPEEFVEEVETRSLEHPEEFVEEVETRSLEHPEEFVEEVETRSLEHPEERVEEVETRSLEHPEEFVEEVETRSLEHPEERVEEVETRSLEHPEERVEEVETRSSEHPEERVEEVETRSLEHPEERVEEVETRSLEHPEERVEEVETRSSEHPEERVEEVETRSLEHPEEFVEGVETRSLEHPEEFVEEVETRSLEHPEERVEEVETRSLEHPEERVEEVETRSLEHPEELVEEVETRSLEHPEERVEEVETRSLEHPEERVEEVETRSLEHPEERVEEVETRSLEHPEERVEEVETRSLEYPEERVEEVETRSLEHPEERVEEVETRSLEHPEERVEEVETRSLEYPEERVEEVETRSLEHPEERVEEVETRSLEHPEERVEEVETRSLEYPEERVEEVETRSYDQKELLGEDERVGKPTGEQPDEFVWEGADYAAEERDELPKDNACPPEGCRLQRDDLVENEEVLKSEEDLGRKLSKTEKLPRQMEQKIVMAESEGLDEHEGNPERRILLGNEHNLPKSEDRTEGAPNEGRLSQEQVDNESLETWMKPEEEEDALNYYEKPKWTPQVDEDADNEQGKAGDGRDESETGQGRRLSQNLIVEDQIGTGTSSLSQSEDEEQFGREEMAAADLKRSIHHHSAKNGAYPQQSDNGARPATAEAIRQDFEEPIGVSLLSQPSIEITPAFEYGGSVEDNLASPQVHSVVKSFEEEVHHSPHEMSKNLTQLIRGDMADEQATNLEEENDSLPMNVAAGHNYHPPTNGKGENEMVGERVNGEAINWSDVSGRGGEVEGDSEERPLLLLKEEAQQRGKKSNGQLPDVGREEGETSSDDTEGADDGESDGSVVIRHQQRSDEEQPQLQSFKLEAKEGSE